ncbi:MAG: Rnf-Nqr domain containing protein [bacterium]|nr:Rnf-Nqr domain containing protein [bacterium]
MNEGLAAIFLGSFLVNNFVLAYFLGICPFLGVSGRMDTAVRMGLAVSLVMLVASMSAYGINQLLQALDLEVLRLISFVLVIATAVQLVELFVKKTSRPLFDALGIFLPLITTNCAILGVALFQTSRDYDFLQSLAFAAGAGAGFTLALLLMAGLREELKWSNPPDLTQGTALTLMVGGILSMAFMGFAGLGG